MSQSSSFSCLGPDDIAIVCGVVPIFFVPPSLTPSPPPLPQLLPQPSRKLAAILPLPLTLPLRTLPSEPQLHPASFLPPRSPQQRLHPALAASCLTATSTATSAGPAHSGDYSETVYDDVAHWADLHGSTGEISGPMPPVHPDAWSCGRER